MQIIHRETRLSKTIVVERVNDEDYQKITKSKYFFNWKIEKENVVYKLRLEDNEEILGLMSLVIFEKEERLEIKLLAVSKENRGRTKVYEGIAENLIGYACREAVKLYDYNGCVSLIPKDELRKHYAEKYGMLSGGYHLFLEGKPLFELIKKCAL